MISSYLLMKVLMPSEFHFPGNWPRNWFNKSDLTKMSAVSLGETAENYDEMIEFNNDILKKNSKLVWRAARLITVAPVVAVLTSILGYVISIF